MGIRYKSYELDGNQIILWIHRDVEDGRMWSDKHSFPIDIVAIRAGEYDMDPIRDEEALWDIILNEVHAFSEHAVSKGIEFIHPLYSAFTLKEAREEALSICRAWQTKYMDWPGESSGRDLIHEIHRNHVILDSELIALHRENTKQLVMAERANRMNFHVYGESSYLERIKHDLRERITIRI